MFPHRGFGFRLSLTCECHCFLDVVISGLGFWFGFRVEFRVDISRLGIMVCVDFWVWGSLVSQGLSSLCIYIIRFRSCGKSWSSDVGGVLVEYVDICYTWLTALRMCGSPAGRLIGFWILLAWRGWGSAGERLSWFRVWNIKSSAVWTFSWCWTGVSLANSMATGSYGLKLNKLNLQHIALMLVGCGIYLFQGHTHFKFVCSNIR